MPNVYHAVSKAYNPTRPNYPPNAVGSLNMKLSAPKQANSGGSGISGSAANVLKLAAAKSGSGISTGSGSGSGSNTNTGTSQKLPIGQFGLLNSLNSLSSNFGKLDPGQYSNFSPMNNLLSAQFTIDLTQLNGILESTQFTSDKKRQVVQVFNEMGLGDINNSNLQKFVQNLFTTTLNVDDISSLIDRFIYFIKLQGTGVETGLGTPQPQLQQQPLQFIPGNQQPIIIQPQPPIIIQQQVQPQFTQPPSPPPQTQVPKQNTTDCNIEIKGVTEFGKYPWIVSISTNSIKHVQSGILIGSEYVLTSTNNMEIPTDDYIVKIGGLNLDNDGEFVIRQVTNVIQHPIYNIMLLQIGKVQSIQPVTINATNIKFNSGTEIGWGKLTGSGHNTGTLHELDVPFLNKTKCIDAFQDLFINNIHACGGYPDCGSILPCVGDTGAPLLVRFGNQLLLQGIADAHINCLEDNKSGLGLWIKIESVLSWLQKHVNDLHIVDSSYLSVRERSDGTTTSTIATTRPFSTIKPGTTLAVTPLIQIEPRPQVRQPQTPPPVQQGESSSNFTILTILFTIFAILAIALFFFN